MGLTKKTILITGASGFIGSFLVEQAIKRQYCTIAGIRAGSSKQFLQDPAIHFLELDFTSDVSLDTALQECKLKYGQLDFVIHNAGVTKATNNLLFEEVNFLNTQKLITALKRNKLVPGKFIYISSLASYGPGKGTEPIAALHKKEPLTAYGRSKLQSEELLYQTADFPFLIFNPTTVYGPREKDVLLLIKSIKKHVEVYIGTNRQLLSFLHVRDLCDAVFQGIESTAVNCNLLVSDCRIYTAKEFNTIVKRILHTKTISLILPVPVVRFAAILSEFLGKLSGKVPVLNKERLKEFEAKNWGVDCKEIRNLGYLPLYSLEEGLKQTIYWYKAHGWIK